MFYCETTPVQLGINIPAKFAFESIRRRIYKGLRSILKKITFHTTSKNGVFYRAVHFAKQGWVIIILQDIVLAARFKLGTRQVILLQMKNVYILVICTLNILVESTYVKLISIIYF